METHTQKPAQPYPLNFEPRPVVLFWTSTSCGLIGGYKPTKGLQLLGKSKRSPTHAPSFCVLRTRARSRVAGWRGSGWRATEFSLASCAEAFPSCSGGICSKQQLPSQHFHLRQDPAACLSKENGPNQDTPPPGTSGSVWKRFRLFPQPHGIRFAIRAQSFPRLNVGGGCQKHGPLCGPPVKARPIKHGRSDPFFTTHVWLLDFWGRACFDKAATGMNHFGAGEIWDHGQPPGDGEVTGGSSLYDLWSHKAAGLVGFGIPGESSSRPVKKPHAMVECKTPK